MKFTALVASAAVGLSATCATAQAPTPPSTPPVSTPVTTRPVMTPGNEAPIAGAAPAPAAGTVATPLVPGGAVPAGGAPAKQPGLFDSPILLIPLVFLAVMIIPQLFSGRKEKKRRETLLAELAHGDRVMTGGGIIGTIVELRDDEIVLKVDEGSNTKIRFTRAAVQQVIRKSGAPTIAAEVKPEVAERVKA